MPEHLRIGGEFSRGGVPPSAIPANRSVATRTPGALIAFFRIYSHNPRKIRISFSVLPNGLLHFHDRKAGAQLHVAGTVREKKEDYERRT